MTCRCIQANPAARLRAMTWTDSHANAPGRTELTSVRGWLLVCALKCFGTNLVCASSCWRGFGVCLIVALRNGATRDTYARRKPPPVTSTRHTSLVRVTHRDSRRLVRGTNAERGTVPCGQRRSRVSRRRSRGPARVENCTELMRTFHIMIFVCRLLSVCRNSFPRQNRMRAIAARAATMHTTATGTLAAPHANATPQRDPHPHRTRAM